MANLLSSWKQMAKQRGSLLKKSAKLGDRQRRNAQQQEEFFINRLSEEMGINLEKIVEEAESRADQDRKRLQPQIDKLKKDVQHFSVQNRRRIEQAIKTYVKLGFTKGFHKLYPNQPHLRMKFAFDWEGSYHPPGVPGIGAEFGLADVAFDPELDASSEPVRVAGHDGLCKKMRAYSHACAGDRRFGDASASTNQTLVFSHDPPPSAGDAEICAVNEVWVPLTAIGTSYARRSDAIFFTQTLAFSGGGFGEVRLSIQVEQDTRTAPLIFPVTDQVIYSHNQRGSLWLFGGTPGILDDGPAPIEVVLNEPYRLPIMLRTADHGGGEVRVVVNLTSNVSAEHRHAEAEIDLRSAGFGVEIHEVFLHVAGYIGY